MKLFELSKNYKTISDGATEDDILRILKSDAKNSYDAAKQRHAIWTKVATNEPYFVVDPSKAKRKSKFIVDELVSILPSWRGWTDRLYSVRGWTNKEHAQTRGSGKLCLLIPFDKARVHAAPESSFYRSFGKAYALEATKAGVADNDALHAWLRSLHKIAVLAGANLKDYEDPETAVQLLKMLDTLDKHADKVNEMQDDDYVDAEELDVRRAKHSFNSKSLRDKLDTMLDPDKNGFDTFTSMYNLPPDREIWTGAKCVVISLEAYEEMHKRGTVK